MIALAIVVGLCAAIGAAVGARVGLAIHLRQERALQDREKFVAALRTLYL